MTYAWSVAVGRLNGRKRGVRVEVLGALRAWRQEQELALGHPRQRALLAMLAVHADRPVGRDELIDGIWGSAPPVTAANCVHSYVARLRLVLEPGRPVHTPSRILVSSGPGYARGRPGQRPDHRRLVPRPAGRPPAGPRPQRAGHRRAPQARQPPRGGRRLHGRWSRPPQPGPPRRSDRLPPALAEALPGSGRPPAPGRR